MTASDRAPRGRPTSSKVFLDQIQNLGAESLANLRAIAESLPLNDLRCHPNVRIVAFGLLNRTTVNRLAKRLVLATMAALTLATVGIAFVSFARKVDSFSNAGFAFDREAGALLLRSVEPGSAAAKAGLKPGDRIVLADGQTAASLSNPEKALGRKPFPHRLVVITAGEVRGASIGEPSVRLDVSYLFLAFVGFLYLIIGLFTIARERSARPRCFWGLCLASFAVYVMTPAGPRDTLWKLAWVAEDVYRALPAGAASPLLPDLPAPGPRPPRAPAPLPAGPRVRRRRDHAPLDDALPRRGAVPRGRHAVLVPLLRGVCRGRASRGSSTFVRRHRQDAEAEKQVRWIGLGVIVGLAPFLILSALPRAFGLESPLLSTVAVVPLVLIPLAFAYAILKWRLWDVEIFVREAIGTTGAVLLGGHDVRAPELAARPDARRAWPPPGKNVIAFASGLVLASLLVPVKKRITDVLERIQYHDTYRARRALLDIARDFGVPRPREEVVRAIVQRVEEALRVVPCSLFLFEGPGRDPDAAALAEALSGEDRLRLRGASLGTAFGQSPPAALLRLHALGYRAFFAMRCGGELVGALGVGYKDGRIPLSSEDEALHDGRARAGQPGLRKRPPLRRARRAARGDPDPPGVPGERHPLLLLGHRRARSRRAHSHGEPGVRAADGRSEDELRGLPARRRPSRRLGSARPPRTGTSGASRRG